MRDGRARLLSLHDGVGRIVRVGFVGGFSPAETPTFTTSSRRRWSSRGSQPTAPGTSTLQVGREILVRSGAFRDGRWPEVVVGTLPPPCSPNGLAFDSAGDLFVADGSTETNGTTGDRIYRLTPNASAPPTATLFVSGVPGANGIAFDRKGNLWAADGTTGQGRVWSITPQGAVTEEFRVQPMANLISTMATTPDGGATTLTGGVGRDVRALPPGTLSSPTTRAWRETRRGRFRSSPTAWRSISRATSSSPTRRGARFGRPSSTARATSQSGRLRHHLHA